MDRIMFGDNQFFGVNHMSEERARAQAQRFKGTDQIVEVLADAYAEGIRTFMCTTHGRMSDVVQEVVRRGHQFDGFMFNPGMPYAHKYADMLGELGMVETLRRVAPGGMIEAAVRGARSAASKDLSNLMHVLVDAELDAFKSVKTPIVFLQNVVADLMLGLGMTALLAEFIEYVERRHGARGGVFTMNMPRMVAALTAEGISRPIICCNYNAINFRMCGGIEAYDRALEQYDFDCIAMSVLASGALEPVQAIAWICDRPAIRSIVFGASSRRNIRQTVDLINQYTRT